MKTRTAAQLHIARLFHYQRFDDVKLARTLGEGTVSVSNPMKFNDPWECKAQFSKEVLDDPAEYERIVKAFVQFGRKHGPALPEEEHTRRESELRRNRVLLEGMLDQLTAELARAVERQYRLYCLGARGDVPLMWSHYADSHRGICLEFSVENELFCGALPVEYRSSYPLYNLADRDEDAALQMLLTKSEDWRYGNEFRLIVAASGYTFPGLPATKNDCLALPEGSLTAVIVGCQMSASERDIVRGLVDRSPLQPRMMAAHRVPNRFQIVIS